MSLLPTDINRTVSDLFTAIMTTIVIISLFLTLVLSQLRYDWRTSLSGVITGAPLIYVGIDSLLTKPFSPPHLAMVVGGVGAILLGLWSKDTSRF